LVQVYKECFIPENYINVQRLRLSFYKQLSSFLEKDEIVECYENIINRFGPAPKEFENYVSSLLIRFSAFHAFVSKVNYSNDMLLITFSLVNSGSLVGLLLDFVSESFEACGLNYFFENTKDGGLLLSFRYTKDKDIATFLIGFFDKLSLVLGRNN
jgi:transcription-repair coupling factor (superfamily II helicase)